MEECTCFWGQIEPGAPMEHLIVDEDCPGHGDAADLMEPCS